MDVMLCRSSTKVFVIADEVVERIPKPINYGDKLISRVWIQGVCEVPRGSGFTASFPDVPIDFSALQQYLASAGDPVWLNRFLAEI
jgi:hypothetical protein